jgi:hypothetical protein
MRVLSVIMAQHMRALRAVGTLGFLPDALGKFLDKYKFQKFPTLADEFLLTDVNKSIDFEHGKVDVDGTTIVIGRLQIWTNGLSVVTTTTTREAELALIDVLKWASEVFSVTFEEIRSPANYGQLEIQFDNRIARGFPALAALSTSIKEGLDDFFGFKPEYELSGLSFSFDTTAYPQIAPSPFKLEPRTGGAFKDRVYFSEAPLATDKHIAILKRFEEICLGTNS